MMTKVGNFLGGVFFLILTKNRLFLKLFFIEILGQALYRFFANFIDIIEIFSSYAIIEMLRGLFSAPKLISKLKTAPISVASLTNQTRALSISAQCERHLWMRKNKYGHKGIYHPGHLLHKQRTLVSKFRKNIS